jgi:hypothetical protein
MRETINNLLERKERLDLFENRTDRLFITSHGSCDGDSCSCSCFYLSNYIRDKSNVTTLSHSQFRNEPPTAR